MDSEQTGLGTNVQTYRRCCGFRSGRIGIIRADSDRHPGLADPDPFQADVKLNLLFTENFNILSEILKIFTPTTMTGKIN
jgi:hypothetical protein